jgi:hypothetical protein
VALARLGEATDWSSLLDRSALPSVTRIRTSAADPSVNTGVDLPTP